MSSCVSRGKSSIPMRRGMSGPPAMWQDESQERAPGEGKFNLLIVPSPAPILRRSAPGTQKPAFLALPGPLLQRLALVVQLLAAGECDLDLRPPSLVEVELERHNGHALALDRACQAVDLALV